MASWTPFAHTSDYVFTASSVKKHWARLHAGDQEPMPKEANMRSAWALFHSGAFEQAAQAGVLLKSPDGAIVAIKASCMYANYLEPKEKERAAIFLKAAERAAEIYADAPKNANAFYLQAYALGRYSQGISVAKAMALGIGGKVKSALETSIRLQPLHADAHIALGMFHADVLHKVGTLIGYMTYGAKKDTCLEHFQQGLSLTPQSAFAKMEYANALVRLDGDSRMEEATALYQQAAASEPLDAVQRLDKEMALAELAD